MGLLSPPQRNTMLNAAQRLAMQDIPVSISIPIPIHTHIPTEGTLHVLVAIDDKSQ